MDLQGCSAVGHSALTYYTVSRTLKAWRWAIIGLVIIGVEYVRK